MEILLHSGRVKMGIDDYKECSADGAVWVGRRRKSSLIVLELGCVSASDPTANERLEERARLSQQRQYNNLEPFILVRTIKSNSICEFKVHDL